ncbi:MAG: cell division topological specificity factor MinE [Synergistaceae bacterium]|nr:cell division topological specificity factor MinE [Synergistaceae bacterium]
MEFLRKWFGSMASSAKEARKRLGFALIYDRTDIAPYLLENLRLDMITVLKKYMDIDESKIEMSLDHNIGGDEYAVALVTNVPVLRIKRMIMEEGAMDGSVQRILPRPKPPRDGYGKNKHHR